MKYLTIIYLAVLASVVGLFLLSGCAHVSTPIEIMAECKKVCRGPVLHYQDDTIECSCKKENK